MLLQTQTINTMNRNLETADVLRNIARYGLVILGVPVFFFALISGAEAYDNGLIGIVKNSPNTLPWLTLLVFTAIAWKKEMIGGALVTTFGMAVFVYFNFMTPNFFVVTFVLTLAIVLLGVMILIAAYIRSRA